MHLQSVFALNINNRLYQLKISHLRGTCNTAATTGNYNVSDNCTGALAQVLTRTDRAAKIYAKVAERRSIPLNACFACDDAIANMKLKE